MLDKTHLLEFLEENIGLRSVISKWFFFFLINEKRASHIWSLTRPT